MMSRIAWWIAAPLIRVIGRLLWRLRIEQQADFPSPPFIIAANHHSFLDPALVGAAYGTKSRFLALTDLFGNYRMLDFTLRFFDVIEVGRGTVPLTAIRQALAHLRAGGVVSVFPEGTRVARFGEIEPRPGAAWLALRAGVPIVPVAVIGSDRVLGLDNRLRRGRIRIVVGPPLHPDGKGRPAISDVSRRWATWIHSVIGLATDIQPIPFRRSDL